MLRPDMLLALSLSGTFVDTLLRTDFAIRKYPSYVGAWPLPRPDFHRLEDACLAGHATQKKTSFEVLPQKIDRVWLKFSYDIEFAQLR